MYGSLSVEGTIWGGGGGGGRGRKEGEDETARQRRGWEGDSKREVLRV